MTQGYSCRCARTGTRQGASPPATSRRAETLNGVLTVADGHVVAGARRIEYCLYNRGGGRRALFQYGTPGTRWLSPQLTEAARSAGFEVLVIDRPGYGRTGRWPSRRVVDVVADVGLVVENLGWDRFAVWGGSGGAPHALAIAAKLPDHVTACASVVGLAPYDAAGLDWYAGMSPGNVDEFRAAAQGEESYRPLVERLAAAAIAELEAGGVQVADDYHLPEVDRRALAARRDEDGFLDRMRLTYVDGVDGWIDDCLALTRPWGLRFPRSRRARASGTELRMSSHRKITMSTCSPASSARNGTSFRAGMFSTLISSRRSTSGWGSWTGKPRPSTL